MPRAAGIIKSEPIINNGKDHIHTNVIRHINTILRASIIFSLPNRCTVLNRQYLSFLYKSNVIINITHNICKCISYDR